MNMSKRNNILTIAVIAFAAFTLAGLAVVPSLQEANANELTLLKGGNNKNHDKTKNHQNHDFTIDEPVIKLVKDIKKPKKDKSDFTIDEPVIKLI